MTSASTIQVRVARSFQCTPERVYDAWLVPRLLGQWMFGPRVRDEKVLRLDVDPRVGGRFSLKVERNGKTIDHVGHYLEMERPGRLVFTWAIAGEEDDPPSRVAIDITATESGCELQLVHTMDARWSGYSQRTHDGWSAMLQALSLLCNIHPGD
jgi:uncharacterized protein YndB with AHSA1/START domain